MAETELKFAIDDQTALLLRERLAQLDATDTPPDRRSLHSVYFDTKGHHLKRAGVALRIRRDGERWLQTVKAKATNRSGLQVAEEAETEVPGPRLKIKAIPDKSLRKSVKKLTRGRNLKPVCETRMERVSALMHGSDGASVEVALDRGEIVAGKRSKPFQELELELIHGQSATLYSLASTLVPGGRAEASRLSKSARGYLLAATGQIDTEVFPRNADDVPLSRDMTVGQAAEAIFREACEQILTNIAVVQKLDAAEGPHQLRIGLRRLRSGFDLFAAQLGGEQVEHLKGEAKWLGSMVGLQRDLDVAVEDLLEPAMAEFGKSKGLKQLVKLVERRGAWNRPVLRDILDTTRVQKFTLALAGFVEGDHWDHLSDPIEPLTRKALNKSWKRAAKRADGIETLDHEARHELRKALKRMRYQIEFAGSLYKSKAVLRYLKQLKKLQVIFGDLNDLAMLEELFLHTDALRPQTPEAQKALTKLLAARHITADEQWGKAQKLWLALADTPAFWRA